jgi:hypothetical protein
VLIAGNPCLSRSSFNTLPFSIRASFSIIMFGEAAALLYLLATRFPLQTHIYMLMCIAMSLLISQITLSRSATELKLMQALNELKRITGLGAELRLEWMPGGNRKLSGEVVNGVIYIYEESFESALETLTEEFVEYAIAEASKPYVSILNALIKHLNEEAYYKRDKVAKGLSKPLLKLLAKKLKINHQNHVSGG